MPYIKWTEKLSIGVDLIDDQHKKMIDFINELTDAMRLGKAVREVDRAVEFLEDYANSHFKEEETLMAKHAYPATQSHLTQHQSFRTEIAQVRREMERDVAPGLLLMRVRKSLADWFVNHINNSDRSLARFLKMRSRRDE